MPNWTSEQQQAIEYRDQSLLVAAAAGSGKTAVLVERICTMVTREEPVDIDRLLVVTFTRAAATEMRERISLRIAKALEENPQNENLVRQLALLNQANIMTIDAFCKKVIEENFHLVDLDPDYKLLDDTETNILIAETMEEVLEAAYETQDPAFLELVDVFGGDRSDEDLVEKTRKIWNFSRSGTDPKAWIRRAASAYDDSARNWETSPWYSYLLREVREVGEEIAKTAGKIRRLLDCDPSLPPKYTAFFREELDQVEALAATLTASEDYSQLRAAAAAMKFVRRPPAKGSDTADLINGLRDGYKGLLAALVRDFLAKDLAGQIRLIERMAAPMKALGDLTLRFYDHLQAKKQELNRVDFADLEHFALQILRNGEGPSEVARIYQQRFEEVLIDEYQDSNDVQEAILTAVSRDEQNIFMVGDVKQSIYRFRQAKPEIFLGKYKRYHGLEGTVACDGRKIMLYRNFRSRPEVLDSVNAVFTAIMSERAGELDYTREEALIFGADYDPEVKQPIAIELIDAASELDAQTEDIGELEDLKGVELEARHVAARIKALVADPAVLITDKGTARRVHYRDIVILLRATSNVAATFKEALEEASVPVFTDTGSGYFESIEIRTMMSLLRTIDNPRQDIPLLAVLRSPLFSFTENELIALRQVDRDLLFLDCLKLAAEDIVFGRQYPALARKTAAFLTRLDQWREESVHQPLDEFIWKIYSDTAYLEYAGAMPNGYQRQANLRILFQRAGEYEKSAFKGLYRFIRYIDAMREKSNDYGDARIMGENEDVVRIMSIHKSKGLEFPVVFLANSGKRFNRMDQGGDMILHEKLGMAVKHRDPVRGTVEDTLPRVVMKAKINEEAISEEMRVLYVAMTRAKERLIITGNVKKVGRSLEKWFRAGEELPSSPRKVLADSSYLDWMMPVILNAPLIRGQMEVFNEGVTHLGDGVSFEISLIGKSDLIQAAEEAQSDTQEPFWRGEELTDEELISVLDYRYPHQLATTLPSKVSVSVIKKQVIEETMEMATPSIMDETYDKVDRLPRPGFLLEERQLTGAERGTAFHTVMLHIDPFVESAEQIRAEIAALVDRELMLAEEAASVNVSKVLGFFTSDLGRRFQAAARAGQLFKEEVFTRSLPARQLRDEWASDDPMTLIGIIDAFFVEEDQIILLDYKTDAIPPDSENYLARKYQAQIDLYASALEAIAGLPVREAYLYSVSREETIRVR